MKTNNIKNFKAATVRFYHENRIFIIIWLIYSILLTITYWVLPPSFESNWFYFYTYLFTNRAVPYIDSRVGYPPLGFLPYMLLAYLTGHNFQTFMYALRAFNASALLLSQLLTYTIIKKWRGKREAYISVILFFALPSVAQYGRFSNDTLALFTTLLAIYLLLQKREVAAGVTIGLAAMVKGFPALLLLPALIWLKTNRERFRLLGAAVLTVFAVSLPFLICDPFMYLSTYIHHGDRGPWETVWALIDGWRSHGGFIHPDFDQFLYQTQLRKIYPLRPNDHAFYLWRNPALPTILFTLGAIAVLSPIILIKRIRNGEELFNTLGLIFFGYIIFFKGYSPQFTVFIIPIILLAIKGVWKIGLCILLDIATELEMLAWSQLPSISNDLHMPMLEASIILRTATLSLALVLLTIRFLRRRQI